MAKKGAIQEDAPGEAAPGAKPTKPSGAVKPQIAGGAEEDDSTVLGEGEGGDTSKVESPRDAKMREIAERRRQDIVEEATGVRSGDEGQAGGEETEGGEAAAAAEGQEGATEADAAASAAQTAAEGADDLLTRKVKIKVQGNELEVPVADVVARAQKNWAADLSLQIARTKEREIEERERLVAAREHALAQQPKPGQNQNSQPSGATPAAGEEAEVNTALDEAVNSLFAGDEQKAKDALKKIIARRPTATVPGIDKREVVAEAVKELKREQYRAQLTEAVGTFKDEFPDLAADEVLVAAWDAETARLQTANPVRSPVEIAREAGKNIRSKFQPNQQQGGTRLERKRQAATALSGMAGVRASTGQEPPRPRTTSEVIAGMRKARGLPT